MLHRYDNQAIAKAFSGIYIVGYIVSHGLIAFYSSVYDSAHSAE